MLAKILQMVASEENKCCMHKTWDDLGQQSVVTVGDMTIEKGPCKPAMLSELIQI